MPEQREIYHFTVPADADPKGERLDLMLVRLAPDLSRTRAQTIIKDGWVKVSGTVRTLPKERVFSGQTIDADAPAQKISVKAEPEKIPLDIMYEDDDILVVNKPAGMVVHPAAGNWTGTLVNAVLGHESDMLDDEDFDPLRPGIVHRLDKDTSGALVIAKTPKALKRLSRAFADREVAKTYLALVHGWPLPEGAVIRTGFGRLGTDRRKMTVMPLGEGREAVTAYTVLKKGWFQGVKSALIQVKLYTGRTHQIRVHMGARGNPLLGEKLYHRGRTSTAPRQMLHAWKLEFTHPMTGEALSFEAPVPEDFKAVLAALTPEKN